MRSRYRVAYLTSHPIQYQAPLFRALARHRDVDLTVLFCSDQGARAYRDPGFGTTLAWDLPLLEGYRHLFLTNSNRRGHPGRFFGLVNPAVVRHLWRDRFDAVIVHGWAYATHWLAFMTARLRGLPLMIRGESNGLREPTGVKGVVKRMVLGRLFRRTAAFLAIGSLNRKFYLDYGVPAHRIFHAPYCVDNEFFQRAAAALGPMRATLRAEEGIPVDCAVFLFCGKLTPVKRPLDLLAAFEALEGRDRAALLYVGDGPLRGAIEERARAAGMANVRVTGFRNQTELPRYYALADVLVLPSAFEPWGLVLNEALNFGLKVIASDQVGAAADLVRPQETGAVVRVGDVGALASSMHRCIDASQHWPQGESKRCIDEWSIDNCVSGIVNAVSAVQGGC
jgi:glycosyltransferase involved in cell wall biosynthesis